MTPTHCAAATIYFTRRQTEADLFTPHAADDDVCGPTTLCADAASDDGVETNTRVARGGCGS